MTIAGPCTLQKVALPDTRLMQGGSLPVLVPNRPTDLISYDINSAVITNHILTVIFQGNADATLCNL